MKWLVVISGDRKEVFRADVINIDFLPNGLIRFIATDAEGKLIAEGYVYHGMAYKSSVNPLI